MYKKSEVNTILGAGVMAAHTYKCMVSLYGKTAPLDYLQILCEIMMESLIMIDMGYSCTTEEMDAELHMHETDDSPSEVKAALMARKILKATEHLPENERQDKMREMVEEHKKGMQHDNS